MRTFLIAAGVVAAAVACGNGGGTGSTQQSVETDCLAGQPDARACDPANTKKTTICHIPPGNPANAHTLCVGNASVEAHVAHGDQLGACAVECVPSPPPDTTGSTGGTTGEGGDTTGSTGGTTGEGGGDPIPPPGGTTGEGGGDPIPPPGGDVPSPGPVI
jgi:hypothetical protein